MCLLFNPASELPVVSFFGRTMISTLIGLVSLCAYYSREELSAKAWWLHTLLHMLLPEAVFLSLAHHGVSGKADRIPTSMPDSYCLQKYCSF